MSMGRSMGLDISGAGIEELAEDHQEKLIMKELAELQSKQQKAFVKENSTKDQEGGEEIISNVIKPFMEK